MEEGECRPGEFRSTLVSSICGLLGRSSQRGKYRCLKSVAGLARDVGDLLLPRRRFENWACPIVVSWVWVGKKLRSLLQSSWSVVQAHEQGRVVEVWFTRSSRLNGQSLTMSDVSVTTELFPR